MFGSSLTSFGGAGFGSIYPLRSCVKICCGHREICRMENDVVLIMDENTPKKNKGRNSQSGLSEDQLVDPDLACNQVVPFGVYRWQDVNLYALYRRLPDLLENWTVNR